MNRYAKSLGRSLAAVKALVMTWRLSTGNTWADRWGWGGFAYSGPAGDQDNYAALVGDPWLNSTVAVCLGWIKKNYPEAPLRVVRLLPDGSEEVQVGHPCARLLERPNPYYSYADLCAGINFSWFLDGNAYVLKHRLGEGLGPPGALYWEPHWNMRPVRTSAREYLSHYVRTLDGQEKIVEVEDVIHFKNGLDPRNDLLGFSELKACYPEIVADSRWARYLARLALSGTPPVILAPKSMELDWNPDTAAKVKAQYIAQTSEANAGKPVALSYAVELHRPAMTPKEMDIGRSRNVSQDMVAAAFGLNSMVLNLPSGAEHKTYANYGEARLSAYSECLQPTQREQATDWRFHLLVDFERNIDQFAIGFDYSKVSALKEDENQKFTRETLVWEKRGQDRAEYRAALGLEVRPEDEGLYFGDDTAARDAEQQERQLEAQRQAATARVEEVRQSALPPGKSWWDVGAWNAEPANGAAGNGKG